MTQKEALDTLLMLKESWKEDHCYQDMTCDGCDDREVCEMFGEVYNFICITGAKA